MGWEEQRARRAEQARRKAAAADDPEATAPLGATPPPATPPGDRWWTVQPLDRHGWKIASVLAVAAILLGGLALARSGDDGDRGGRGGGDVPARMADGQNGGGHRGWR